MGVKKEDLLFKFLDSKGVATTASGFNWLQVPLGEWLPRIEKKVELCKSGYHSCHLKDLFQWTNTDLYVVEYKGDILAGDNKVCGNQARIIKRVESWNPTTLRLFAADCAERVLKLYEDKYPGDDRPRKAIEAARNGDPKDARAAAYAARAAAYAAYDAAYAAADAAYAAYAARAADAAYAARAADAAYAAENEWQIERLWFYLKDELENYSIGG